MLFPDSESSFCVLKNVSQRSLIATLILTSQRIFGVFISIVNGGDSCIFAQNGINDSEI